MKKLFVALILAVNAFAAGSATVTLNQIGDSKNFVLSWAWVGDASTGSVPATSAATVLATRQLQGYQMQTAVFVPASPSPTAGYAVTITDVTGLDVLGGQASSLSATAKQGYSLSGPPINGALTLNITGQSVASAQGTVYLYLVPTLAAGRGGGGGSIGGSITGQTINCLLKANSATTSTSSSGLCDDGTTISTSENVTIGVTVVSPGALNVTSSGTAQAVKVVGGGTPTLASSTALMSIDTGTTHYNGLDILGTGGDISHYNLRIQNKVSGLVSTYITDSNDFYTGNSIVISDSCTYADALNPTCSGPNNDSAMLGIWSDTLVGIVNRVGNTANSRAMETLAIGGNYINSFDADGSLYMEVGGQTTYALLKSAGAHLYNAAKVWQMPDGLTVTTGLRSDQIGIGEAAGTYALRATGGNVYFHDNQGAAEALTFDVREVYKTDGPSIQTDSTQLLYLNPNGNKVAIGGSNDFAANLMVRQASGVAPFMIEDTAGAQRLLGVTATGQVIITQNWSSFCGSYTASPVLYLISFDDGTNGTCGDGKGSWQATSGRFVNPVAVASLPACASGTLGKQQEVNDATVATPGSAAVGSGTFTIAVQCTFNSTGSVYTWIID